LSRYRGEWRVIVDEGVGQWGGQAAIMMCGCDGGWYGGDASLKSVFAWIRIWRRAGAKDCCCRQAAMVLADHVNLWWGVELLIPLLKHTK